MPPYKTLVAHDRCGLFNPFDSGDGRVAKVDYTPKDALKVDLAIDIVEGYNNRPEVGSAAKGSEPRWSL